MFLVEPETLLVEPDTDNIEDWKKFHTQTTELLDLKTIMLTELIGFINAKLYYLEEADQLNDASLNVAEMLDLQKAKKKKEEEEKRNNPDQDIIQRQSIVIDNIKKQREKKDPNDGMFIREKRRKRRTQRKIKRRKKIKDIPQILDKQFQSMQDHINRYKNRQKIQLERGIPYREKNKNRPVTPNVGKQYGGINTELYNNDADISGNIMNLYENEKNIDIGRDLYENVVFTGGAIYKLPIGYTKQNQIINNLFKVINKSNKKIKIGGNRPSIIEKPLIGGDLQTIKRSSLAVHKKTLDYIKLVKGLQKYYDELGKKTVIYDNYLTEMTRLRTIKKQRAITIGEMKNYLNVMNAITELWKRIGKWSDISHFKKSKIQKKIFNKIDTDIEKEYEELLDPTIDTNEKEERKVMDIRNTLLKKVKGDSYKNIIENLVNKNLIKTILHKTDFFTDDAKSEFLAKYPYIEKDETIKITNKKNGERIETNRIDATLNKLWDLYDKYYIMIQKWQNYTKLVTSNENISSTTSYELEIPEGVDSTEMDSKIKEDYLTLIEHFGQFLIFRDELDEFQLLTRRPISLYARINDIGRDVLDNEELKKYKNIENFPKQGFFSNQRKCAVIYDKKGFFFDDKVHESKKHADWKHWIDIDDDPDKKAEYNEHYKKELQRDSENLGDDGHFKRKNIKSITGLQKLYCSRIRPYDYIQWYEKDPELTGESGILTIDTSKCKVYNSPAVDKGMKSKLNDLVNQTTIKFQEVFWRPEFDDNKNISSYMLLDKLITRNIGTYLVTYGYSGVGKSFTLFGRPGTEGLLQATVGNISTVDSFQGLSLRVYELYGMGLGYSDCWKTYEDIDQSIYHYNIADDYGDQLDDLCLKLTNDCKVICRKGVDIPNYITRIHTYTKPGQNDLTAKCLKLTNQGFYEENAIDSTYFQNFPKDQDERKTTLNNFTNFIKQIESDRATPTGKFPKRVNATVNNPQSSRAKLVYDFMFKFEDANRTTITPLVIDDTPGAENLVESYITKNIDIEFYDQLQDGWEVIDKKLMMWQYSVLNATLVNPLFVCLVNPAGVLTGFNRIIAGEKIVGDIDETLFSKFYKTMKMSQTYYDERVTRMSELFKKFFESIKNDYVTDKLTLTNYVHINDFNEIVFEPIPVQDNYSKDCCTIYEIRLFAKFWQERLDRSDAQNAYDGLDKVMNKDYQIRPKFTNRNTSEMDSESRTIHLAVWLILKLIKFCSKRSMSGTLKKNEMKYDMLIELLAYSTDMTGIFKIKPQNKDEEAEKRLDDLYIELGEINDIKIRKRKEIKAFKKKEKDAKARSKEKLGHIIRALEGNGTKEWNKVHQATKQTGWKEIRKQKDTQQDAILSLYIETVRDTEFADKTVVGLKTINNDIKKVKGMKTKIIGDIFDKLPLPIQFGMLKKFEAILIDELGKYPNETRGLDINNIYELIRDTPKIVGRTEWTNRSWREKFPMQSILLKLFKTVKTKFDKKMDKEDPLTHLMSITSTSEEFYRELFLDSRYLKPKYLKNEELFGTNYIKRCKKLLLEIADPLFRTPIFRYYTREDFKRYITLAMESWYIDQNISGILKKCSEISGIKYRKVVKDVVSWQYNNENEDEVSQFVLNTPKGYKPEATLKDTEILKKYGFEEGTKEYNEFDIGKNNEVSLVFNLQKINEFLEKNVVVSGSNKSKSINIQIIKYIQEKYDMTKLFPIKNFTEDIIKHNTNMAKDYLGDLVDIATKENIYKSDWVTESKNSILKEKINDNLKKWSKKKIDSVIGVLMNPYLNKPPGLSDTEGISIEDYKMFYVLANNSTQLKCYDQLKTFNMFSNFITQIPK